MSRDIRVCYPDISKPVTLSGVLAPGEHRGFVANGYTVHLEHNLYGISVYVTGPEGLDKSFPSLVRIDPTDQTQAWEHANKLFAQLVAATAPAVDEIAKTSPPATPAIPQPRVPAHAAPMFDGQVEREYVGDLEVNIQCVSKLRSVFRVWVSRAGRDIGLEHLAHVYDTETAALRSYTNARRLLANGRLAVAA